MATVFLTEPIYDFSGPHAFLANDYQWPILFEDGIIYPTADHLFQATKTDDLEVRQRLADEPTVRKVWRAGSPAGYVRLHSAWDRDEAMYTTLMAKFRTDPLDRMLYSTGEVEIAWRGEDVPSYWGQNPRGAGTNRLGQLIMRVREENGDPGLAPT